MTFHGDYTAHFRAQLNRLKTENRYRNFVELERIVGRHPVALRHHNGAAQEVTAGVPTTISAWASILT